MNNVINIDDHMPLEKIIRRRVDSDKFILAIKNNRGGIDHYISDKMTQKDMILMINILLERMKRLPKT